MRDDMIDLLAEVQRVGSQKDLLQTNITRLPAGGMLPSGGLCRSLSQILREARDAARAREQRRCCDVLLAAEGVSPRALRYGASGTPRGSNYRREPARIVHRHHHQHQHHHYVVAPDVPLEQLEKWEEAMNRSSPRQQSAQSSARHDASSCHGGQVGVEATEEEDSQHQHLHYHHHTGEREVPLQVFAQRLAEAAAAGLAAHKDCSMLSALQQLQAARRSWQGHCRRRVLARLWNVQLPRLCQSQILLLMGLLSLRALCICSRGGVCGLSCQEETASRRRRLSGTFWAIAWAGAVPELIGVAALPMPLAVRRLQQASS